MYDSTNGDDYVKWLNEANKKYESCAYSCRLGVAGGCALDGYPVLDCLSCSSYKERKTKV